MIQAIYLRIDNWVTYNGKQCQIEGLMKGVEVLVDGIPLTPEILEKCGFEKGCLIKHINDDWFIYYNDMMWLQVEIHDKVKSKIVCERIGLQHIEYLHELQNLYYCLCKKELIYNP